MRLSVLAFSFLLACGPVPRGYYRHTDADAEVTATRPRVAPGGCAAEFPCDLGGPPDLGSDAGAPAGAPCWMDAQCASAFCDCSQHCRPFVAHCHNGVQDFDQTGYPMEAAVDCGGPDCHGCPSGTRCDVGEVGWWDRLNCESCSCDATDQRYTCL